MLTRGVFDKETRRKPLAFAADAVGYGICTGVWGATDLWVGTGKANEDGVRCCREVQEGWLRVVRAVVELG
jgi:hypothetical protein